MAVSPSFLEHGRELFAPFGDIVVKRMFGGAGVYCDGLFFAVLDDGVVYLKVDDVTRAAFEAAGLAPFTFEAKDGSTATMSYYAVPDEFYEDDEARARWVGLALDAARRAKNKPSSKSGKAKSAKAGRARG